MHVYTKQAVAHADTASTPEAWEANFAGAQPLSAWTAFRLRMMREWDLVRRYIPRGARVADMGSGPGWWVRLLSLEGYAATGVDYSARMIARARSLYPESEWIQARIQDVPLPSSSLDAIISWGVIEHDPAGPAAALKEFFRLVVPGGRVIVTVPIDTPVARRAHDVFETGAGRAVFFQYLMSEEELRRHVTEAGFEVIDSGSTPSAHINHVAPNLAKRMRGLTYRLAMMACWLLLSWMKRYRVMIYAVGRKPEA